MAHNIESFGSRTDRINRLTVVDILTGAEAKFVSNGAMDFAVQMSRPDMVIIEGEDLYALREFLNELPEEAFVRPADPVAKSRCWTEGDLVQGVYLWRRGEKDWARVDRPDLTVPDDVVESWLGAYGGDRGHFHILFQKNGA